MYDICLYGNPILRQKSKEVTEFNDELVEYGKTLVDLMYEYDGIGLASPQIGQLISVVAIDVSKEGDNPLVLVNPKITYLSEEVDKDSEGCLSVPSIRGNVVRPKIISFTAFDIKGKELVFDKIDGLFARAVQHEIDHLNGIIFTDKVDAVKKRLIASKLKKMAKQNKK